MVHKDGSNDMNNHENTKEGIIKTAPFTVDYINNIIKRSLDIRSEIENLIDQTPFLSEPHKKVEGFNLTKPDTNPEEHLGKTKDPFQDNLLTRHSDKNNKNMDLSDSEIFLFRNKLLVLIHKLGNINDDMILSLKNLKEKYEQQKEFINIAAHEIRGPSHAIMGYVDLLHEDPLDNKRYLESITRNAERLNLLISNILDVSRIDNKMLILKKEKFDLINLINQIIEDQINQISQQKRIDIQVNLVTTEDIVKNSAATTITADIQEINHNTKHNKKNIMLVNADKLRLAQVISNLLVNALKFTAKGRITITIREGNLSPLTDKGIPIKEDTRMPNNVRNKKEVIVEVKDSGKGIDSIILPKVFSKFISDANIGGTGLGLYISKNIIEAHGGKIWAKNNEDGKGATFSFSLPKVDNEISNGE